MGTDMPHTEHSAEPLNYQVNKISKSAIKIIGGDVSCFRKQFPKRTFIFAFEDMTGNPRMLW